jgi:hypothetical protein
MRLINTEDYSFRELYDPGDECPYGILSHTWDETETDPLHREVAFRDMRDLDEARKLSGWEKIEKTCELARNLDPRLQWVWIDTCCIDKSSSAELTEAINSMFRWYREAKICFVYLKDLAPRTPEELSEDGPTEPSKDVLGKCRWFTRGWTLQELIAPKELEFYDAAWEKRGSKASLLKILYGITWIDEAVLKDSEELSAVPICRRMSWAATRQTNRVEDIAYCLFGIFDVNMPLIYGEGEKAFIRLQEALVRQTHDLTLFAWYQSEAEQRQAPMNQTFHGMFSPSPKYFRFTRTIIPFIDPNVMQTSSFTMTNRGLEFSSRLLRDTNILKDGWLMTLHCHDEKTRAIEDKEILGILLSRTPSGFVRASTTLRKIWPKDTGPYHIWMQERALVRIPPRVSAAESRRLESRLQNAFRFRVKKTPPSIKVTLHAALGRLDDSPSDGASERDPTSTHAWEPMTNMFLTGGYPSFAGLIWPIIREPPPGMKVATFWPRNVRILCGFRESPSPERKLLPWVALQSSKDECAVPEKKSDSTTILQLQEHIFQDGVEYEPNVAALGSVARRKLAKGETFPTAAMLAPYKLEKFAGEQRPRRTILQTQRLRMSLELTDVNESGIAMHEVAITLVNLTPKVNKTAQVVVEKLGTEFVKIPTIEIVKEIVMEGPNGAGEEDVTKLSTGVNSTTTTATRDVKTTAKHDVRTVTAEIVKEPKTKWVKRTPPATVAENPLGDSVETSEDDTGVSAANPPY